MKAALRIIILSSLILHACGVEEPLRPNIIFIMSDDHAYQAISSYGGSLISTPNLDRIASGGAIFTSSFVSNSICAPSRAVMLTGKHSHRNGQLDNSTTFDGSQLTFPKLLREAGYRTAMIGKWHLRSDPSGFDYWNVLPGQGQYYNPDFIKMGEEVQYEGYVTNIITDLSIDWLNSLAGSEEPFCLLVHHKAPHRTWQPDTSLLEVYAENSYPLPGNFFDDYQGRKAAESQRMSVRTEDMDLVYDLKMADAEGEIETRFGFRMDHTARMNPAQKEAWDRHYNKVIEDFLADRPVGEELETWKFQRYMRDYLACVESVDSNTGRLLDYLAEQGLDRNTIVIYTSDQGFYLGEHGWFDKRFMYEESLRTPLLISTPWGGDGSVEIGELIQNIDYAPTILDLAGVAIPADMDGKSFAGLLRGEESTEPFRDAIYYHYYEYPNEHSVKRHYGIRTDRYKLIHFYYDIDEWELYDLNNDPAEMNNLYDDPDLKDTRDSLHKRLDELREYYRVPPDTAGITNKN